MAEALKSAPEGRVTLRNVGWETFERLVEEDPDRSAPRFFYVPIYAHLGDPEVWRHDGDRLAILGLPAQDAEEGRHYAEIPESALLAPARVTGETVTRLVKEGLASGRPAWTRRVREWARGLSGA